MSYYRNQLESWLGDISLNADRVYDVGGKDKPVLERLKVANYKKYRILDLPEYNVQGFNKTYPQADVVFCLEVMEYIHDPMRAINNLAMLTRPLGFLYISFPFLYPVHNPAEDDMMRYTKFGAEKLLKENGFEIIHNEPRKLMNTGTWDEFIRGEKYKFKGALETDTVYDTGYLIKAGRLE